MKQLRERVSRYGACSLSNHELLLIILGTGSGKRTIPEAMHHLLEEYPLQYMLGLDYGQIAAKVGAVKAVQVLALLEFSRRVMRPVDDTLFRISSPADAANLVMPDMVYLDHEEM